MTCLCKSQLLLFFYNVKNIYIYRIATASHSTNKSHLVINDQCSQKKRKLFNTRPLCLQNSNLKAVREQLRITAQVKSLHKASSHSTFINSHTLCTSGYLLLQYQCEPDLCAGFNFYITQPSCNIKTTYAPCAASLHERLLYLYTSYLLCIWIFNKRAAFLKRGFLMKGQLF